MASKGRITNYLILIFKRIPAFRITVPCAEEGSLMAGNRGGFVPSED